MESLQNLELPLNLSVGLSNEAPNIDPFSSAGIMLESLEGRLEFRDVNFAYPLRPEERVLKGVNLVFEAGQVTALVGPSGCGKSTITALLGRWYDPSAGVMTLDGIALKNSNVRSYRSNIRFVQEVGYPLVVMNSKPPPWVVVTASV